LAAPEKLTSQLKATSHTKTPKRLDPLVAVVVATVFDVAANMG
jgi:hypothetical protein